MERGAVRRTRRPSPPQRRVLAGPIRLAGALRGRSVALLVSLLTLLAVGPWLNERLVGLAIWELLFTLVMLSGIARLSVRRGQAVVAALLALPAMACLWLRQIVPAVGLTQAGLGLLILFLLYTAATVLLAVFREETVTMDTLSGAFCVYLLMGLAWGSLDSLLYLQAPGSFRMPEGWTPMHQSGIVVDVPFNIMVYYSFTTLTTVGYGDVLPLAAASRTAAILEAVLGHFYLAVLVARLVGLHIAYTQRPR
ncbi:MAG TPA: potassium channel family protein [Candidatus Limnocylindria bacterium]